MSLITYEPKVSFRHRIIIDDFPAYICKAANMPSIDNGEIVIDQINSSFKVKGKSYWQDVTVTLFDPVTPVGASALNRWILMHHNAPLNIDGYKAMYQRQITIQALDPLGIPMESWTLINAYAAAANFGDMDWSNAEAKMLEVTIKYDYAILVG